MDPDDSLMSTPINPNNFPAKMWRLVNNPFYQSICWDSTGAGVIIDQQLFESELLCPSKGMSEATDLFKTSNFTSFIRQLNLYGFRKLIVGSGSNAGPSHSGEDVGAGESGIHHFYNDNFRKGRPDLLVKLKRMTSTNKAKLAAGLEVNSRPPNRFQRSSYSSLAGHSKGNCQDLTTVEQLHRTCRRENFTPYPYVNPPSHNRIAFPGKELDSASTPPRTWSNSFGLHQRQLASHSSFPDTGMFYPVLHRYPTDITYTMQSTATSVHVQQGHPAMPGPMQRYTSYMPHTAQYPHPYYPSAILPYCPTPAHLHHLNGSSSVSSYQQCSYFQSPPMHPSFPMEFFNTNWMSSDSNEFRKDEMNLESAFPFADEIQSTQEDIVRLDTVESLAKPEASPLMLHENATVGMSPGYDATYCTQTNQLESLLPVSSDITNEAILAAQSVSCQSPLTLAYSCPVSSDDTKVYMNTSSNADQTLCDEEVDVLVSDVTSPNLNLLVEGACKRKNSSKKEE
ncbi:heat shock factor protein 5 [Leptodactylus fuscus]|uniref:heat shock factor protein 5 n=1 Tax=Leptodactylus fuscus TaxID=238119 RepID=UPI003F4F1586